MNKVKVTKENVKKMLLDIIYLDEEHMEEMCDEIATLVASKNQDYGDAWQTWGVFTPLVRINDKILRLETIDNNQRILIADETVKDTLRDILGYSALALLWLEDNDG